MVEEEGLDQLRVDFLGRFSARRHHPK